MDATPARTAPPSPAALIATLRGRIDATLRPLLNGIRSAALVRAVVNLCETHSLEVIACGVETATQRDALRTLGCTRMQGYLFGMPGAVNTSPKPPPTPAPSPAASDAPPVQMPRLTKIGQPQ